MNNLPDDFSEEKVEKLIEKADEVRKNTFSTFTEGSV
jgi:hypothetical protein